MTFDRAVCLLLRLRLRSERLTRTVSASPGPCVVLSPPGWSPPGAGVAAGAGDSLTGR